MLSTPKINVLEEHKLPILKNVCVSVQDTARDEALECITVGVLTVVSEDSPHEGPSSVDLQPISTAIILEGGIVMDRIKNLPQAVCLLFGLTYALYLDYPKCMANTLNFIQTVMLGLEKKNLPPKLSTLKNSLLDQTSKEPSAVSNFQVIIMFSCYQIKFDAFMQLSWLVYDLNLKKKIHSSLYHVMLVC